MPMDSRYLLDAEQIFTLFFIMLGPLGILVPYAARIKNLDQKQNYALSAKAIFLSVITLVIGGLAGSKLLFKWNISAQTMLLTGGIIFFLVALKRILQQYEPPHPAVEGAEPLTPIAVAFPMIITPFGMATVIVLMSLSQDSQRTLEILTILLVLMLLNLVIMIFARQILKFVGMTSMRILAAALSVLQLGLAMQMILVSLHGAVALIRGS